MTIRAVLLLLATLGFAVSPLLSSGFGGYDPSQFPVPIEEPPVLPAGYAFSLWGLIYAWLIAMAGFGLWRRREDAGWDASRLPILASLAVGAIWIEVATASPIWATVLIFWMLVMALWALLRTPDRDVWLLRAPVGLYAGWLTAASCVSLGTTLTGWAVPPLGPNGWAIACLALALAIGVAILRARPSVAYGAAIVWALVAVTARDGFAFVGLFALGAAIAVAAITATRTRAA